MARWRNLQKLESSKATSEDYYSLISSFLVGLLFILPFGSSTSLYVSFFYRDSSLFLRKTGRLYFSTYRPQKSYQQRAMNQGLLIESLEDGILYNCFFTPKMKIYNTIPLNFLQSIKSILKTPPISFLPY